MSQNYDNILPQIRQLQQIIEDQRKKLDTIINERDTETKKKDQVFADFKMQLLEQNNQLTDALQEKEKLEGTVAELKDNLKSSEEKIVMLRESLSQLKAQETQF